jgi:hypothetical protein
MALAVSSWRQTRRVRDVKQHASIRAAAFALSYQLYYEWDGA